MLKICLLIKINLKSSLSELLLPLVHVTDKVSDSEAFKASGIPMGGHGVMQCQVSDCQPGAGHAWWHTGASQQGKGAHQQWYSFCLICASPWDSVLWDTQRSKEEKWEKSSRFRGFSETRWYKKISWKSFQKKKRQLQVKSIPSLQAAVRPGRENEDSLETALLKAMGEGIPWVPIYKEVSGGRKQAL